MGYKFHSVAPAKHLSGAVKNFFVIEFDKDITRTDYLLPDGLPSFFCIQTSEPVNTYFGGNEISLHTGFYVGYSNTTVEFSHKRLKIAGASIFPVYFSMIFGKSPLHIINQFNRLEEIDILKPVRFLLTASDNSFARIGELFEKYISDQLNKHPLNADLLLICEELTRAGDHRQRIDELAERLGYSTRYLHSRFIRHFGMPPKKFIRLVRFNQALKYIYDNEVEGNLSSIAHAAGYHDQSHFIRDFKAICGKTPKQISVHSSFLAKKFCMF